MYCSLFVVSSVSSHPLLLCKTSPCIVGLASRRGLSDVPLRSQCMDDDSNCFHFSHVSTNHMRLTRPALLPCSCFLPVIVHAASIDEWRRWWTQPWCTVCSQPARAVTWQGGRGGYLKRPALPTKSPRPRQVRAGRTQSQSLASPSADSSKDFRTDFSQER